MKFLEHEAKSVFAEHGIPIPGGFLIRSADELSGYLEKLPPEFVLKAQVDVGGRGKAGGILIADRQNGVATARSLFGKTIKGVPVREILAEERLPIIHGPMPASLSIVPRKRPLSSSRKRGGSISKHWQGIAPRQ